MKKFAWGFVVGAAITSALTWLFVVPQTRDSYRAVGFNDGNIAARWEISKLISQELGKDFARTESQKNLYNVKSSSVVVVERNGIKTLRTVE
jgi:hypothetical protein